MDGNPKTSPPPRAGWGWLLIVVVVLVVVVGSSLAFSPQEDSKPIASPAVTARPAAATTRKRRCFKMLQSNGLP